MSSSGIWRPPQWQDPAVIMITFPGQGNNTPQYASLSGIGATLPTDPTSYVFDAVIRAEHAQDLRRTEHPVQTGASISDHAYIMPARLILDIGMSDAMDEYSPGMWTGAPTKSVSAYQTMLALQYSRIPLTITTKLRSYTGMVIDSLSPEETAKTVAGLRMRVEFGQIFIAEISIPSVSARPQDTGATNLGVVTPEPLTSAQLSQNLVQPTPPGDLAASPSSAQPSPTVVQPTPFWKVIGAGIASSFPIVNSLNLPIK